ncbi:MAG: DJ-1/PfpI family protein [Nitriliruptor sp.]|nr:MAG: DJ-1/PfpI family protein [Nitriliruptor sp.]
MVTGDPRTVGVLVYTGCDLLDVGGPYEAVLTADRLQARRRAEPRLEVVTVAPERGPVTAYGGLELGGHRRAQEVDHLDVIVVPGTVDVDAALGDARLLSTVDELARRSDLVASVCTGSFLLAAVGLLEGRTATTHHEDLDALAAREDVGAVRRGVRFVADGPVVTAAGLSSGLSLGLHLVDRLGGRELAMATARQLEHPFDPEGHDGVG